MIFSTSLEVTRPRTRDPAAIIPGLVKMMMSIAAGILSYLLIVDAMQLAKISPAEQRAINEGPKLLDELVPSVLDNIERSSDLYRCMQVSYLWYTSARKQLLRVCGRLGQQNEILPDFTKILKSSCNRMFLTHPYRMELGTLHTLIKDKPSEFTRSRSLSTWARDIISAIPFILETEKCCAFTGMVDEMIEIGGFGDVIEQVLPFRDDIFWDPAKLAWRALLKGETLNLVLKLAQGADEENKRALELASSHSTGKTLIVDFLAQVKKLPAVPLQLLLYLCRICAEDFICELIQSNMKFTGNPDDCVFLRNLCDCGPIALEIARYSRQFTELRLLSSVLLVHEHLNLYSLEVTYLPVLAYMAFGDGPFGKAFRASSNTFGGLFEMLTESIGGAFSVAADNLYSYLKGSYNMAPESVDLLMEVIFLLPTTNFARQDIEMNMQTFVVLIEHPVLSHSQKKKILQHNFRRFPADLESAFKYLKDVPNSEIGYYHTVDLILGFTERNVTFLHSFWKYLFDEPELVLYIDTTIKALMKTYHHVRESVQSQCKAHITENVVKPLPILERNFIQRCIAWIDLSDNELMKLMEIAVKDDSKNKAYKLYLGFVNSETDPSKEIIEKLCVNPQTLCRTMLHLMNVGGPQRYYDALLQSPKLTDEVMRDVVLFAIYLNASEKEIIQLLKAKRDLPTDVQSTICSGLVQVSFPEVTVRNIFATLSKPGISFQAFQAASTNQWYSEDFLHLLKTSVSS